MGFMKWFVVALGTLAAITSPAAAARSMASEVFGNVSRIGAGGADVHDRQLQWKADVHDSWQRDCIRMCMAHKSCADLPDPGGGGGGGGWKKGKMTYYWGAEPDQGFGTGPKGGCDNALRPLKSVAVPQARWKQLRGRRVRIQGVCDECVVDDLCAGPGCREFDLYVGYDNTNKYDGVKDIKYKVGGRVKGHPCLDS